MEATNTKHRSSFAGKTDNQQQLQNNNNHQNLSTSSNNDSLISTSTEFSGHFISNNNKLAYSTSNNGNNGGGGGGIGMSGGCRRVINRHTKSPSDDSTLNNTTTTTNNNNINITMAAAAAAAAATTTSTTTTVGTTTTAALLNDLRNKNNLLLNSRLGDPNLLLAIGKSSYSDLNNASFSSSETGSIQSETRPVSECLSQSEMEEYSRPYYEQHPIVFNHQKQSSYAQSEGYHSYVSSSDSSSTPFLDRLRQDSEVLMSRASQWSQEITSIATSNQIGTPTAILTTNNNGSETSSSTETLKLNGSMSDVSVASQMTNSSLVSTGGGSQSQLIAHSSRVRTPKRHNSESVLYMADDQMSIASSSDRGSIDTLNKINLSIGGGSSKERPSRNNNRLFPINTYTESSHCTSPETEPGGIKFQTNNNWQSVAERINELERQHSSSNTNQKYTYLDPSKTHRVSNPTLKAFQKNAVQSYFQRQHSFRTDANGGPKQTPQIRKAPVVGSHQIGRPQSLQLPHVAQEKPAARSSLPNIGLNRSGIAAGRPAYKQSMSTPDSGYSSQNLLSPKKLNNHSIGEYDSKNYMNQAFVYNNESRKRSPVSPSGKYSPHITDSAPPPPPPRNRYVPPARRTSSASEYATSRDQILLRSKPNLSKIMHGPMVMGRTIALDDWVPERPPKNPNLRVPSPDLPPPPVIPVETDTQLMNQDEPLPPPPPEIYRHTRQMSEPDDKQVVKSRRNSFAGATNNKSLYRASTFENLSPSTPHRILATPEKQNSNFSVMKTSSSVGKDQAQKAYKVILNNKLETPKAINYHHHQHPHLAPPPPSTPTFDEKAGEARLYPRKRLHNSQASIELTPTQLNKGVALPPLKPRMSIFSNDIKSGVPKKSSPNHQRAIAERNHHVQQQPALPPPPIRPYQKSPVVNHQNDELTTINIGLRKKPDIPDIIQDSLNYNPNVSSPISNHHQQHSSDDGIAINEKLPEINNENELNYRNENSSYYNLDCNEFSENDEKIVENELYDSDDKFLTKVNENLTMIDLEKVAERLESLEMNNVENVDEKPVETTTTTATLQLSSQKDIQLSSFSSTNISNNGHNNINDTIEELKLIQKTEIILHVNPLTSEAASQTDEIITFEKSDRLDTDTSDLSKLGLEKGRQKLPEEIECDKLSKDLANYLKPSDKLFNILAPLSQKYSSDYVEGLFNPDLVKRSATKDVSTATLEVIIPSQNMRELCAINPLKTSVTSSFFPSKEKAHYNREMTLINGDSCDLMTRKEKLLESLKQKLNALSVEQGRIAEEIIENETFGNSITLCASHKLKPSDATKLRSYIDDIGYITMLLLSLSSRLARVDNALQLITDTTSTEKKTLEAKKNRLIEQLDEAKRIKEDINRRGSNIHTILEKCLNPTELEDYTYFINMKAKLLVDSKELSTKLKFGEEQIVALKETMFQSEC